MLAQGHHSLTTHSKYAEIPNPNEKLAPYLTLYSAAAAAAAAAIG